MTLALCEFLWRVRMRSTGIYSMAKRLQDLILVVPYEFWGEQDDFQSHEHSNE